MRDGGYEGLHFIIIWLEKINHMFNTNAVSSKYYILHWTWTLSNFFWYPTSESLIPDSLFWTLKYRNQFYHFQYITCLRSASLPLSMVSCNQGKIMVSTNTVRTGLLPLDCCLSSCTPCPRASSSLPAAFSPPALGPISREILVILVISFYYQISSPSVCCGTPSIPL